MFFVLAFIVFKDKKLFDITAADNIQKRQKNKRNQKRRPVSPKFSSPKTANSWTQSEKLKSIETGLNFFNFFFDFWNFFNKILEHFK